MREATRREQMKRLNEAVYQLRTTLSVFKPQLLGDQDFLLGYSELMQFLGLLMNGGQPLRYRSTGHATPIANAITGVLKAQQLYPHGHLAQYLLTNYGVLRKDIGGMLKELCRRYEVELIEGHAMSDHVHLCVSIPPKHSVANTVGRLKGKSAIMIAQRYGRKKNFSGMNFWARDIVSAQ